MPEVRKHIAARQQPELRIPAGKQQPRCQHQRVTNRGNAHHDVHQPLPGHVPGNHRIEHHQEGRCRHAYHCKDRVQPAAIAVAQIDVRGANAGGGQTVAYLLNQEDQRDPQQLIVACDRADDLAEADGRSLLGLLFTMLPHAENGEAQEQRRKQADDQRNPSIRRGCVAAQRHVAGGQHRNDYAGQRRAHTRKQRGPGGEAVAGILV